MKYILSLIIWCMIFSVNAATVYTQTDSDGNVTYSDIPQKNASLMEVPETTTVGATQNTPPNAPAKSTVPSITTTAPTEQIASETERKPYTVFNISSPNDQSTFQNEREIPVTIQLEPNLQEGDQIQIYVDGNPYGAPVANTQLTVNQLDRGTHTLTAILLDKNKAILKTSRTITIFVQYARLGPNNAFQPKAPQ